MLKLKQYPFTISIKMEYPSSAKAKKFMQLVEFKAQLFSKDDATKVCALIVAPGSLQELSSGWNGMPRGINESIISRSERPAKYHWYEHAERNAIYNASRSGTRLDGSIMFVNRFPCADCARAIIQCGIHMVVTVPYNLENENWRESWLVSAEMMAEAGIKVVDSDYNHISNLMYEKELKFRNAEKKETPVITTGRIDLVRTKEQNDRLYDQFGLPRGSVITGNNPYKFIDPRSGFKSAIALNTATTDINITIPNVGTIDSGFIGSGFIGSGFIDSGSGQCIISGTGQLVVQDAQTPL